MSKTSKGHPKRLKGKHQQCPDEQYLGQAVNDRNGLETAAFGMPVIQIRGLSTSILITAECKMMSCSLP